MKVILVASDLKKQEYLEQLEAVRATFELIDYDIQDREVKTFLILGGDGTLNYFINSFHFEFTPRVFYYPAGTANDFSRTLKLSQVELIPRLLSDSFNHDFIVTVPILTCNDRKFINVASCGLPARVTQQEEGNQKKSLGVVSYYLDGIKSIFDDYSINIDVKTQSTEYNFQTKGFIVSQGLYAGGGLRVNPSYVPCFGDQFNYIIIDDPSALGTLTKAAKFQLKADSIDDEGIFYDNTDEILISCQKDIEVKLDGEAYSDKKLFFSRSRFKIDFLLY